MKPEPHSQQPNPSLIFNTINAYQRTEALKTAIELDLFTHLSAGATNPKSLADKMHADPRAVRILCDYLVIIGFLAKSGQAYDLTQDSRIFLDRNSRAYLGDSVKFLLSSELKEAFSKLTQTVSSGSSQLPGQGSMAPDHPMWVTFARSMAPLMAGPASEIARLVNGSNEQRIRILDVAAGHGLFGISFAKVNPNAEIVALDWPSVLEVAKENAAREGVANRYSTLPGNAFEIDTGRDFDLVLLTNFLHHVDIPTGEKLIRKLHASLKPDGKIITFEFVPNEDRITPPEAASFSLTMLATTPKGDAYTFSEFKEMFRNTGFPKTEIHQIPASMQQLLISYKK